jgi:hypothetical protein
MKRFTRTFKRFAKEMSSEKEIRDEMGKRGYHVVEVKTDGRYWKAWCIYVRNLPKNVREHAKTITRMPEMGQSMRFNLPDPAPAPKP